MFLHAYTFSIWNVLVCQTEDRSGFEWYFTKITDDDQLLIPFFSYRYFTSEWRKFWLALYVTFSSVFWKEIGGTIPISLHYAIFGNAFVPRQMGVDYKQQPGLFLTPSTHCAPCYLVSINQLWFYQSICNKSAIICVNKAAINQHALHLELHRTMQQSSRPFGLKAKLFSRKQ